MTADYSGVYTRFNQFLTYSLDSTLKVSLFLTFLLRFRLAMENIPTTFWTSRTSCLNVYCLIFNFLVNFLNCFLRLITVPPEYPNRAKSDFFKEDIFTIIVLQYNIF